MTQTLFVDKSSDTFADALLAYGLAIVVDDVLSRTGQRAAIHVSDHGAYYCLTCEATLDDARLASVPLPYMPAVFLRTGKNAHTLPAGFPPSAIVDYDVERDKRAEYFEARKKLSQEALTALRRHQDHPGLTALHGKEPHPDWDIFRAINPSAIIGYNKTILWWWQVQAKLPSVLMLLRDLFSSMPNDLAGATAGWKDLAKKSAWEISPGTTAAQIYNPSQGKGQNRSKADKLQMGNVKDAFWLQEWLKAVGFYRAALTKQLRGTKDRKTYVLAPAEIDLIESDAIMQRFRGRMARSETSVRSDVLMAIRYTQALLEYTQESQGESLAAKLFEFVRPSRVVAGFYNAFYKDLGNASATMNLAFIRLPEWVCVRDTQDVVDELAILREHESIVRQFDESHSDDFNLLLCYRDFISGNDLVPFFAFCRAYSSYIIGQRERPGGRARQFSEENLRRLIVNAEPKLSEILDTPGFRNIAYAIRQSTVVAQYRKQQGDRRYDVRYGLGQQLARKANYPRDFIAALGDFLHKYNAENAQVMEARSGPYRRSVHTDDIEQIVSLVDVYGSQLVCNLLIAYGYARMSRDESSGEQSVLEQDVAEEGAKA